MKPKIVSHKAPLEERLAVMQDEIADFITARAKEINQGGVPLEVAINLLSAGRCPCLVVFRICDTMQQDAEIAARQERKENVRNATA